MNFVALRSGHCSFLTLLFMGAIVLFGCKKNQPVQTIKDPKKEIKKDNDADALADEQVDIPANITGSYLACALRKEAQTSATESQYGCRLSDPATQKKLDLQGFSQKISWTSNLSDGVTIEPADPASPYHILYSLKASSPESLAALASNVEAIASWKVSDGTVIPVKREKISQVLRPDIQLEEVEIPVPRDQTITPN